MPAIKRRSSWFVTLPVAAAALGFLWLVFIPTAKAIRADRQEITAKQQVVLRRDMLQASIQNVQNDLKAAHDFITQSRADCPSHDRLAGVFGMMTELARKHRLTTLQFEPQHETALETLHIAPVRMIVTGSYNDFCRLLASLERLPIPMWIAQARIEPNRETAESIEAELVFEVFADYSKTSD